MAEPKLGKNQLGEPMHYSAGAVIKNEKGEYLLIERMKFPPGFAGPAGHIDEGETGEEAVVREVNEETGLVVTKYMLINEGGTDIIPNPCSKGVHYHYWYLYNCEVTGVLSHNLQETKSIGWYTPEQIKELELEPMWGYWFKKLEVI